MTNVQHDYNACFLRNHLVMCWCCPLGCNQGDHGLEEVSVARTNVIVKHSDIEQCLGSAMVSGVQSSP